MKIYLIRHAHYLPVNDGDGPLTDKGKVQSTNLAKRLIRESVKFKRIYSSPKTRAREIADICCKIMGNEGIIFSGQLVEEQFDEEPSDVVNRMKWFIDFIKSEVGNDSCAVFSHCYAIRYLLNSIEKNPDRIVLPHAGIALLDYIDSKLRIMDYNPKLHLEGIESY